MKRATMRRATKKVATKRNGKTRRQLSLQALVKAQMEAKVKEVEYNGPKIPPQKPGKVSYRTRLSAVRYAREILVRAKMYDEAAKIRDIERSMESMFNLKIKKQTKAAN